MTTNYRATIDCALRFNYNINHARLQFKFFSVLPNGQLSADWKAQEARYLVKPSTNCIIKTNPT